MIPFVNTDVTQGRSAAEVATWLAALVDSSGDAIISKDLQGIVTSWNKGAEKIFGFTAGEMIGGSIRRLIPDDRLEEEDRILEKIRNNERVAHFETLRRTRDGRLIDVSVTASPIRDEAGRVVGVSKVARDITERKRAETARQTSESRYRALFDYAPDGILIADPESYYLDANPSMCRRLGYTRDELIGKHATDIIAPEELPHLAPAMDEIRSGGHHREWKFRRRDGSLFTAEVMATTTPDGNLMGVIRDVSERKKIEEELQLAHEKLRQLLAHSPAVIYTLKVVGGTVLPTVVSDNIERLLGFTVEESSDANWWLLHLHPEDRARVLALAGENGLANSYCIEYRIRHKDGTFRWVEDNHRVVADASQQKIAVGVWTDITARKLAEESVLQSEARFRELAENIQEVFWMTDPAKNEMLYISPAYEKIWGRSCRSLYAAPHTWLEAIHPDDRPRVLQAAQDKQAAGTYDEEYRILRPDGSVCWIHDRAFPIRNAAGEAYRIVGTAEDVTKRRRLEEQFLQSQKMEGIGQLAGGVAHDFNNILAVIQMQSELLKDSGGLSAEQVEFTDEITTTVQRAAALTRQLLLFSRREVFQPCDLDLNETVTGTVKMLKRILGEDIRMQLRLPAQPMFLHADAGMMDQILLNLVVNARDAMPHGGQLVIETSGVDLDDFAVSQTPQARTGSFVLLQVSDTGSGMPPEVLARIFEPFFTTKDVGKGTGLGLATVFGIVQQHQGWINVYSEVGHGTTFRIYLPRLAKPSALKPSPPTLAHLRGGQETLLLVEDDPALRTSVRKALVQLGYRILEAPSGLRALDVWKEHRADIRLLLTDLVMPDGMTGRDLARRLLQEKPGLKVVYMSGYSAEVVGQDFPLREGVNFLTKPFQAFKLAQTIRNSLDTPK